MGKIEEHDGKNYLVFDDFMLDKLLLKAEDVIGIGKFEDTKILTDDNLLDDVTLKCWDSNYMCY